MVVERVKRVEVITTTLIYVLIVSVVTVCIVAWLLLSGKVLTTGEVLYIILPTAVVICACYTAFIARKVNSVVKKNKRVLVILVIAVCIALYSTVWILSSSKTIVSEQELVNKILSERIKEKFPVKVNITKVGNNTYHFYVQCPYGNATDMLYKTIIDFAQRNNLTIVEIARNDSSLTFCQDVEAGVMRVEVCFDARGTFIDDAYVIFLHHE